MMYCDLHAHFAEEGYEFPAEWERIRAAGVERVVLAGDTVAHSRMHAAFADAHAGAYFCAGVHPSEAERLSDAALAELEELCRREKCVAVGEIGLDYHYPDPDRAVQRRAFVAQIRLAESVGLPLQIHSRDCAEDMLALLREERAHLPHGFLMHCYAHGKERMKEFLALGAYFSFGGVVCFKNARRAAESAAACPEDRILSETDSPYLSPFRGEKNTPANLPVIVRRLAELQGREEEEMKERIARNAEALFPKLR